MLQAEGEQAQGCLPAASSAAPQPERGHPQDRQGSLRDTACVETLKAAPTTTQGHLAVSLGTGTALQEALSDKNPGPSYDLPSSIVFPQKSPDASLLRAGRGTVQSPGT